MSQATVELDPIRLEIIANGLRSIADECFVALMRSSYSTNIKERKDHSIAIVDKKGRLVVQAELTLPIHIASMGGLMKCVLEKFGDDIHEGDIFVANDPHTAGGTHLPDINYAMPIFIDGEIVAFVCNIPPRRHWRHGSRINGGRHVRDLPRRSAHSRCAPVQQG